MKLERLLATTAAALLIVLGAQVGLRYLARPGPRTFAMWKDRPASVEAATALADIVVQGRVIRVRRADDLVGIAPGEPGGVDRIPMSIATFRIDKTYKGSGGDSLEIAHTGSTDLATPATEPEPTSAPPPKPPDGNERPPGPVDRSRDHEARTFVLDDDPPYQVGERYVLFLRRGPRLTVQGGNVDTLAIVSPEGRYKILAGNRLEPATHRGFAGGFRDRPLQELESRIPR